MKISEREVWIDWLRVVALFLVMLTHCCEPFYLGGDGSQILTHSDAVWVAIFDALPRACVPLFVVASSYLLFPLRYSTNEFFKKRVVRVFVPFVIWTVAYALASDNIIGTFKDLVFNFNYAAGHPPRRYRHPRTGEPHRKNRHRLPARTGHPRPIAH